MPIGVKQAILILVLLTCPSVVTCTPAAQSQAAPKSEFAESLHKALQGTAAVAVLVDAASGQTLASVHPQQATSLRELPGSTLKPLILTQAFEDHTINAETEVFCRRKLQIGSHNLDCTHPQLSTALNAQTALAYSCNLYFANLAGRMKSASLIAALRRSGLDPAGSPATAEERQLLALGLQGILVSPAQMAEAYRRLWLRINDPGSSTFLAPVRKGLRDSVDFGMAHNAARGGLAIYGKTGTAIEPKGFRPHGWFVGITALQGRDCVLAVYLPNASGADAALLAKHFYARATKGSQP